MLQLGKKQELTVVKRVDFGVYLAEGQGAEEKVLLPRKEVPEGTRTGDKLTVFLYKDSMDRPIATVREPLVELDGLAVLKVKEVGRIGAFLDWGLDKDLLLPFKEQTRKLYPGDECLVAMYVDKSSRLCATMKVYSRLKTDSPYHKDDTVKGTVYEISDNFGVFVAVDNQYSALIPKREVTGGFRVGDRLTARVAAVKADGKLDLSIREKAYLQIDEDAENVMRAIEEFDGVLPFGDHADPEVIKRELGMSKNAFKRAVGRLYKERRVEITEHAIRKVE